MTALDILIMWFSAHPGSWVLFDKKGVAHWLVCEQKAFANIPGYVGVKFASCKISNNSPRNECSYRSPRHFESSLKAVGTIFHHLKMLRVWTFDFPPTIKQGMQTHCSLYCYVIGFVFRDVVACNSISFPPRHGTSIRCPLPVYLVTDLLFRTQRSQDDRRRGCDKQKRDDLCVLCVCVYVCLRTHASSFSSLLMYSESHMKRSALELCISFDCYTWYYSGGFWRAKSTSFWWILTPTNQSLRYDHCDCSRSFS